MLAVGQTTHIVRIKARFKLKVKKGTMKLGSRGKVVRMAQST